MGTLKLQLLSQFSAIVKLEIALYVYFEFLLVYKFTKYLALYKTEL